jgi:hypothetical protein
MNRWSYCWLFVIVLLAAGCGPGQPKPPPLAKVAGTVTLDGQPMEGGEVRFSVAGQPAQVVPVQGGAFDGKAFVGQNQIEVVWEKDAPNPSMPDTTMKVNSVSSEFQGAGSPLKAEVGKDGATDLKFAVTSAK